MQALDAGRREHDGVEAAFFETADACRHVAAQRLDAQILAKMLEPHAAARRGGADARAIFQRQPIAVRAGQRIAAHEQEIGGVDTLGYGGDRELGRRLRRQVLERVHGELDAPLDERLLDLAHEHALRTDRAERRRRVLVARRLDDRELDRESDPLERRGHRARLRSRQLGAACAEPQSRRGAHASPSRRARAATGAVAVARRRRPSGPRAARRRTRARGRSRRPRRSRRARRAAGRAAPRRGCARSGARAPRPKSRWRRAPSRPNPSSPSSATASRLPLPCADNAAATRRTTGRSSAP